jgi:hypothetical protein
MPAFRSSPAAMIKVAEMAQILLILIYWNTNSSFMQNCHKRLMDSVAGQLPSYAKLDFCHWRRDSSIFFGFPLPFNSSIDLLYAEYVRLCRRLLINGPGYIDTLIGLTS